MWFSFLSFFFPVLLFSSKMSSFRMEARISGSFPFCSPGLRRLVFMPRDRSYLSCALALFTAVKHIPHTCTQPQQHVMRACGDIIKPRQFHNLIVFCLCDHSVTSPTGFRTPTCTRGPGTGTTFCGGSWGWRSTTPLRSGSCPPLFPSPYRDLWPGLKSRTLSLSPAPGRFSRGVGIHHKCTGLFFFIILLCDCVDCILL